MSFGFRGALTLLYLWHGALLTRASITSDVFDKAMISDLKKFYTSTTWPIALQQEWDAIANDNTPALFMLQINGLPDSDKILRIESYQEVKLENFAPPDLYFFMATKSQASKLREFAYDVADVQTVPHKLKVLPSLRSIQENEVDGTEELPDVVVDLSPGSLGSAQESKNLARAWKEAVSSAVGKSSTQVDFEGLSSRSITMKHVKGKDMARALEIVSLQPQAMSIEQVPNNTYIEPKISNPISIDFNARRLNGAAAWVTASGTKTGQTGNNPLAAAGLDGSGEVVGVGDSGLDDSSCFFNGAAPMPRDFIRQANRPPVEPNLTKRKVVQYIAYADGIAGEARDHGTHVAGSVAGLGDRQAALEYNGMAPGAKIAFYDIGLAGRPSLAVPRDLTTDFFPYAKEATAAIHTNSWGANTNAYTSNAAQVDKYSWDNPDFVILIAAGNSGAQGANTVGSPATAKNCITVGASVNPDSRVAGTFEDIAGFSSVGPAADGRIKPDVVAPGHQVASAGSSPTATASQTCQVVGMSGTSMATPVVAGNVAVLRQYFREGWYPTGTKTAANAFTPSGALLKAMIIHSGKAMTGNVRGTGYPGIVQGFGRIDMDSVLKIGNTLADRGTLWVKGTRWPAQNYNLNQPTFEAKVTAGQSQQETITLLTQGTLKATLVWMDPPSGIQNQKNLINDLDLTITKGAETFYPNGGTTKDSTNNVEMIEIPQATGSYTVTVTGASINSNVPAQHYALVITGPFAEPAATSTAGTATGAATTGTATGATTGNIIDVTTGATTGAATTGAATGATSGATSGAGATTGGATTGAATGATTGGTGATGATTGGATTGVPTGSTSSNSGSGSTTGSTGGSDVSIIDSGNCTSNNKAAIRTVAGCQSAATKLGLANPIPTEIYSDNKPEGCYTIGGRVYAATNPANDGNGVMGERRQICRPEGELYRRLKSGTCTSAGLYAIYNAETCAQAATELRLGDTTASTILGDGRPDGCYYKPLLPGNALFVPLTAGSGVGASNDRELICALTDPSPPAPATTVGGYVYRPESSFGGMGAISNARHASMIDVFNTATLFFAAIALL